MDDKLEKLKEFIESELKQTTHGPHIFSEGYEGGYDDGYEDALKIVMQILTDEVITWVV